MRAVDKLLLAFGGGFFVGGWLTRHPELAICGLGILCGYGIVRMIAGEWPKP